jgi:hypothetical protein
VSAHEPAVDKCNRHLAEAGPGDIISLTESLGADMATTQFCDRYRERNVANPRQMLALRNSKVDLSKWEPVSFGHTPPSKVKTLAAQGFVIIEIAAQTIARAARRYRPSRSLAVDVFRPAK